MPLPDWFELDASQVRIDSGLQPHQLGDGTLSGEAMEALIDRFIALVVPTCLTECRAAAGELSFPNSDEELKRAFPVILRWPVTVAHDATPGEIRSALREAKDAAEELIVLYPLRLKFEAQSGDPDSNVAIEQSDIEDAAEAAITDRAARIQEQIDNFTLAVSELVIAKLWYSAVTDSENPMAKSHYIAGRQLIKSLKELLAQNYAQHVLNRGGGFF